MKYPSFIGPSNAVQSPIADAERTVNFYPEPVQSRGAPTDGLLLPTPGLKPFHVSTDVGTRALFEVSGRCFAVIGGNFYELFATKTATLIDAVAQDSNPATISYNGQAGGQLFVTSGNHGYCYVLSSGAFTQVLTNEATQGGWKDGRFLAFNVLNGRVRESALNDGTTWPALVYFERSLAPDPWQAMVVGTLIWMIGEQTSEGWYNAGTSPQPFAPSISSLLRAGTNAPFSVQLVGSAPIFLKHDQYGSATITRVQGYTPQTVSNAAVATALSAFDRSGTLDDCETLVYQEQGHTFACFNFSTAHSSWCLDLDSGLWHERGDWDSPHTRYNVWGPRVHCHAFGKHLVGDRMTGTISEMDVTIGTQANGDAIRRLRIAPPIWAKSTTPLTVERFSLRMQTGLGLISGQGSNPEVDFRYSDDGETWKGLRRVSAGARGKRQQRVYWTQCGGSPTIWTPEVVVSDGIPWRIAGADINCTGMEAQAAAA